jgi:hypothetical protein
MVELPASLFRPKLSWPAGLFEMSALTHCLRPQERVSNIHGQRHALREPQISVNRRVSLGDLHIYVDRYY